MNREDLLFSVRTLARSLDARVFAQIVSTTAPIDVIDALDHCDTAQTAALLLLLSPEQRATLFAYFQAERQDLLLQAMPAKEVVALFEQLPSDDRADIFNRLSPDARQKLLPELTKAERDDILKLAAYPEGTVGSATSSDYAALGVEMNVEQAIASLRATAPDKETIDVVFVLDTERRLLGTVTLRDLVLATPNTLISDLMKHEPVLAQAQWSLEQAVELIRRYDLLALPVINAENHMIGIVTVDDAMDIEKEQDATQLARFGGTASLGGPDLDVRNSPFKKMFGVRVFWLAILTFFGIITSNFVAAQEEILSQAIILAAFIAPIVDMGGNTGSQSATLVIRSMALGELKLRWRDVWFILKRELPVAAALGITIAILEIILAHFSKGVGFDILMVVGLSMLVCTTLGGVIGALLPFAARRIGTDPATLSSPLITSVMDLVGVFIYFGFAYAFLGDLLTQTTA